MAEEALWVNFNQDMTSMAVGTRTCYQLYSIGDELTLIHQAELEDVSIIERLFSSSLITIVTQSAPRKLRVTHFQKATEICAHSYANTILAVKLNRLRVVVCLEEALFVHNIRDMKVLHTIRDTPPNTHGVCDLSSHDSSLLAYPGSTQVGQLHIFDAANLHAVTMIQAHDSPLAAVKFSQDATMVATASDKGTVIRVFSVPKGERLFEFRRGVKRCVTIHALAFNEDNTLLGCSSNTETVHVFKLNAGAQEATSDAANAGWGDYLSKAATNYLPTNMTEMLQQDRAFATAKLPIGNGEKHTAIALTNSRRGESARLLVASTEGYVYIYSIDARHGGEAALMKQHRFITGAKERTLATTVASAAPATVALQDQDEFPPMQHEA